jgi:hypothetical protein
MTLPLFARKIAKDMITYTINSLWFCNSMKIIKETIRMPFIKKGLLCGVALLNILALPFWGIGLGYSEPVFSVTSDNESLNEVLAKVSKSTGYKIEITKGRGNQPLTASLKKITFEKGLREIMRIAGEQNYALVVNDTMKKVEIRIFGNSSAEHEKGSGTYVGTSNDFRRRSKATAEGALVDVSRDVGKLEEPPAIEITPPEIEVVNPEIDAMRRPE